MRTNALSQCCTGQMAVQRRFDRRSCGFARSVRLHLRVFLEYVGVPLSQQLDDRFIRNTAGTETRRVCRARVVAPKIRNPRLDARLSRGKKIVADA